MKVNSPLANMEMYVGSVAKQGDQLVIRSREDSTMPAEVFVAPQDAWDFAKSVCRQPWALLYVLVMPFLGMRGRQEEPSASLLDDPLNKPW